MLTVFLGVLVGIVVITWMLPTTRRMWIFQCYLLKYGGLWLADRLQLRRLVAALRSKDYNRLTVPMLARRFCEDMGPTYIKFAQLVASSHGVFPERYCIEFGHCLDSVVPMPFSDVQRVVAQELGGDRLGAITEIEAVPLASASIAQVHEAVLADHTQVVLKVQRLGIEANVAADMKIMRWFASVAERVSRRARAMNPKAIVEDFAHSLQQELDFRTEAKNQERFNDIMVALDQSRVRAPRPHWDLTTRRVLVMERFFGARIDDAERIRGYQVDPEATLIDGLRAWFQGLIFHGFFHGDVHAGNLMVLEDGRIGFLDFGIVGVLSDRERWRITDYIVAIATSDFSKLAQIIVEMASVDSHPSAEKTHALSADLAEVFAPLVEASYRDINYGDVMTRVQELATLHNLQLPREFVLLSKQLLYFDRYAKQLAPDLNIFRDSRLIAGMMADIMRARTEYDDTKHSDSPARLHPKTTRHGD